MSGIYLRTEKHKRMVSETIKKYFSDPENRKKHLKGKLFQKGQKPWNTGLKAINNPKLEHALKLAHESLIGKSPWNKGKKGLQIAWNKNKKGIYSDEYRQKIGIAHSKEKSSFWKGGISIGENKKEYKHIKRLERIAREHNAAGCFSVEDWLMLKKICNYSCMMCGKKESEIKLTIDHIIPLIWGGNNYITDVQPLCRSCNSKKGSKLSNFGIRRIYFYKEKLKYMKGGGIHV